MAVLFAALLATIVAIRPFNNTPDIRSDGVGYHAWAHAIAHGDVTFCKYGQMLRYVGAISEQSDDGLRCRNKYPPGVGLLQLAFSWPFLAAHPDETGYSVGENRVVLWGGSVLLFVSCVLLCATVLRRGASATVSLVAVAAMVFGTGLFHYATYDASFSHIYSAFGLSVLLWLVYGRPGISNGRIVAFALVAAWLYSVRQTNAAVSLAVVYVYLRETPGPLRWRVLYAWLSGTGFAAAVLLIYGKYVSGHSSLSSYGSEGFPSFGAHFLDVLVSYERGLISYYPAFGVAVILALFYIRKPVHHAFVGLVCIFALLYGSWHAWSLGAGFGHRGFVELAPFGVIVLADALRSMSAVARKGCFAILIICCMATTFAMSAYWRGELPFEGATAGQYWRSVVPTSLFHHRKMEYTKTDIQQVRLGFDSAERLADGQWEVRISIKNGNRKTPILGKGSGLPPLRASWRVVSARADVHQGWDPRLEIPELEPGQGAVIVARVPGPAEPGSDQHLQFSLVQEGVFWAHDIGVAPLDIPWSTDRLSSFQELKQP
ncbi:hypothetical protein [Luteibacter sp. 621]|uniref:hypothetical protein n=1 Tax=Luteibacter sp. 621 TaxID=3373916 RepID=UPI003D1E4AC4